MHGIGTSLNSEVGPLAPRHPRPRDPHGPAAMRWPAPACPRVPCARPRSYARPGCITLLTWPGFRTGCAGECLPPGPAVGISNTE